MKRSRSGLAVCRPALCWLALYCLAGGLAFTAPGPALGLEAPPACWSKAAAEAVAVRVLQSELTVGALACHLPAAYARFVDRQGPALGRHGGALTAHYRRAYGDKIGQRRLDALVTRLANQASARKTGWRSGYCDFVRALLVHATAAAPGRLGAFAARQPHAEAALNEGACAPDAALRAQRRR